MIAIAGDLLIDSILLSSLDATTYFKAAYRNKGILRTINTKNKGNIAPPKAINEIILIKF